MDPNGLTAELQKELDELRKRYAAQLPPDVVEAMKRATDELVRSGIAEQSLKPGDLAPDFELPNAVGAMLRLSRLLENGPVVVTFYRGAW